MCLCVCVRVCVRVCVCVCVCEYRNLKNGASKGAGAEGKMPGEGGERAGGMSFNNKFASDITAS